MLILSVRRLSSYVRIWVDVRFWRIKTVPTLKRDLDLWRGINYKFSLATAIHRIKCLKNTWICQNKVSKNIIVQYLWHFIFRFRACLNAVNNFVSDAVGHAYFTILSPPCFTLQTETVCEARSWWSCTRYVDQECVDEIIDQSSY